MVNVSSIMHRFAFMPDPTSFLTHAPRQKSANSASGKNAYARWPPESSFCPRILWVQQVLRWFQVPCACLRLGHACRVCLVSWLYACTGAFCVAGRIVLA